MKKSQLLAKLKDKIIADKVCPELAKQATGLVFGEGNPDAEIVYIGEAPGKQEDLQGKPFVGASGKFLNEMLQAIGLSREEVYITNIVKYRPPNNRDPLPIEKQVFLSYLQTQLEIIQPKLVVTLGRHSMNCFLPGLQISSVHGKPKRISLVTQKPGSKGDEMATSTNNKPNILKLVILPLFHPAAALYNGSLRQTLIEDFMKTPKILQQI